MEGGVKKMCQGINGMVKMSGEGRKKGVTTFRTLNGRLLSSNYGKREILSGQYKRLGILSQKAIFD